MSSQISQAQHVPPQSDKPDILTRIETYKRREILAAKGLISGDAMRKFALQAPATRGFAAAISKHLAEGRPALIAEIKNASPSKGLIRPDFDPPSLARGLRGSRRQLSFGVDRRAVLSRSSRLFAYGTRGVWASCFAQRLFVRNLPGRSITRLGCRLHSCHYG
jgi:hypothetical protein